MVLINDCGVEADELERRILAAIPATGQFKYERNEANLGFVGTCNRAVARWCPPGQDVLLLNSDTVVTENFLEEMLTLLAQHDAVAAVSPRSNNASLATVPVWAARSYGIPQQESYELYLGMRDWLPASVEVPVAHGFCMLLRRSVIDAVGLFDTAFGRGYGEEVDFSMRARSAGYTCRLANRAFVFHDGARSFTREAKQFLVAASNRIIEERYPDCLSEVDDYIARAVRDEAVAEARARRLRSTNVSSRPVPG